MFPNHETPNPGSEQEIRLRNPWALPKESGLTVGTKILADPETCFQELIQRIAKGAGGKGPRQKTSKIVKKCQKVFRHFSTNFAQGKKRQKSSKSVKKFFDTFRQISRRHHFSGPFCNPLTNF